MRSVLLSPMKSSRRWLSPMNLLCLLAVMTAAISGSLGQLLAATLVVAILGWQFAIRRQDPGGATGASGGLGATGAALPWGNGSRS